MAGHVTGSEIGCSGLPGSDQVHEKVCEVVVTFVQRQPGGRSPAARYPGADECRLPKAGRGNDQGKGAVLALVQTLCQSGAGDNVGPGAGDKRLGDRRGTV